MKSSTIEHAETRECVLNLAVAWHDGYYTDQQAEYSAELQGLSFIDVTLERSRLYEADAKAGAYSWN